MARCAIDGGPTNKNNRVCFESRQFDSLVQLGKYCFLCTGAGPQKRIVKAWLSAIPRRDPP
eukprot:scaffold108872_cov38-Prasinocladus_malaysianus.AAC.1